MFPSPKVPFRRALGDLAHDPVPGTKSGKAETKTSSRDPWLPLKYAPGAQDSFSTSTKNRFSSLLSYKSKMGQKKTLGSQRFLIRPWRGVGFARTVERRTWGPLTAFTFSYLGGLCRSCRGLRLWKWPWQSLIIFLIFLTLGANWRSWNL